MCQAVPGVSRTAPQHGPGCQSRRWPASLQTGQTALGSPVTRLPGMTDRKAPSDYCTRNEKGRLSRFRRDSSSLSTDLRIPKGKKQQRICSLCGSHTAACKCQENISVGNFLEEGCFPCGFNLFLHMLNSLALAFWVLLLLFLLLLLLLFLLLHFSHPPAIIEHLLAHFLVHGFFFSHFLHQFTYQPSLKGYCQDPLDRYQGHMKQRCLRCNPSSRRDGSAVKNPH